MKIDIFFRQYPVMPNCAELCVRISDIYVARKREMSGLASCFGLTCNRATAAAASCTAKVIMHGLLTLGPVAVLSCVFILSLSVCLSECRKVLLCLCLSMAIISTCICLHMFYIGFNPDIFFLSSYPCSYHCRLPTTA